MVMFDGSSNNVKSDPGFSKTNNSFELSNDNLETLVEENKKIIEDIQSGNDDITLVNNYYINLCKIRKIEPIESLIRCCPNNISLVCKSNLF